MFCHFRLQCEAVGTAVTVLVVSFILSGCRHADETEIAPKRSSGNLVENKSQPNETDPCRKVIQAAIDATGGMHRIQRLQYGRIKCRIEGLVGPETHGRIKYDVLFKCPNTV